jgi:hypothetical protein
MTSPFSHLLYFKQKTTTTNFAMMVLPIAYRIRSTGGFAAVRRALVLTIDQPFGGYSPTLQ